MAANVYEVDSAWDEDVRRTAATEENGRLYNPGPQRLYYTVTEDDDPPETLIEEALSLPVGAYTDFILDAGDRLWLAAADAGKATWEA